MQPKPLSKTSMEILKAIGANRVEAEITPAFARKILAALEYERQRAEKGANTPPATIDPAAFTAEYRRQQTEAVVPKRKRRG